MDDIAKLKRQRFWLLIVSGIAIAAAMGLLRLTPLGAPLPAGLYLMYWIVAVALAGAAIFIAYAQAISIAERIHDNEGARDRGLGAGDSELVEIPIPSPQPPAPGPLVSNLVYNISHELRTSLASLKAATDTLLEGDGLEPGSEYYDRLLQSISRNVARQESLVSNIVDMASIENASIALHLERIGTGELVAEVTSLVAPLVGQRRQILSVSAASDLPPLVADRQRLSQVLVNLLSNAQKYSPEGAEIVLDVQRRGGSMVFTVSDSGPGIPAEERERVFDAFYRVQSDSNAGIPGSGLGLAITRALVELHSGSIRIEDSPAGGAAFVVSLPVEGVNT